MSSKIAGLSNMGSSINASSFEPVRTGEAIRVLFNIFCYLKTIRFVFAVSTGSFGWLMV